MYVRTKADRLCEGLLMAKVEEVIAEDKTYQGMTFNHDEMHIVCPWHGWGDLATGDMVADRKFRLKPMWSKRMTASMSPSDEISDEDFRQVAISWQATARIAQETGDPLANVDHETEALKQLAQKLIDLPEGEFRHRR